MPLVSKTIYIAQRDDDGSAWREVYISGSGLLLQTDSDGHLTGSTALPSHISILSASYASWADNSTSSSYANVADWAYSSSWAISSSFASYSNSSAYATSASWAVSASRAYLSNFAIQSVSSSYSMFADQSKTSSYSINADFSKTASYAITSSHSKTSDTASFAKTSETSSYSLQSGIALTASYAMSANVPTGSFVVTASGALTNETSSYALTASYLIGGVTIDTGSLVVTASGALTNETASYSLTSSYIKNVGAADGYLIGSTEDGFYGPGATGSVAGIQEGDRVEDAFDKIEDVLFKLAPARPPALNTKSLTLTGGYSANRESTNSTFSNVTNNTLPVFTLSGGMIASNGFGDGDVGQLSAMIDGSSVGTHVLTPGNDIGTYGALQITSDQDYYIGQAGKAGFWNALLSQITTTSNISTVGPHTAQLQHTRTGNTPALTFYIDDPSTPSGLSGTVSASGVSYISGVPALVGGVNGASVTIAATGSNVVGRFYNSTRIFQGSGTGISTSNFSLPSNPPSGSTQMAVRSIGVNAGSQTENASFTITAFNSAGGTSTFGISGTLIRMDSALDPTSRVQAGSNIYPSSYGGVFNPATSVATNEELQLLNGQYRYPTGDYTSAQPVSGPNYTTVSGGSYLTYRWVTFNMGTITNKANIRVDFSNTFGFTGVMMSNFKLQTRVDGAIPTVGWVDGNSAFPGTGNPTNNGDAGLVVASSTTTSKLITFGTAVKTGTVYVRIGIPQGDTKRFGNISITAT